MYTIRRFSILSLFLFIGTTSIWSQHDRYKTDSLSKFNRSFGYGVSNLLESITMSNAYRPQVYFDYSQYSSKDFYYRASISFNYSRRPQGNLIQHDFIPFNFTIGAEKHFYKNNFYFVVGADLFYSMSLRKVRLSPFQGDDFGVGIAPLLGVGYALKENLSLFTQYEAGLGFFRSFASIGNIARPSAVLLFAPIRNVSFGLRHFF